MPGPSQRNRTADIAVTIVLLTARAFLLAATVALLGLLIMATDSCGGDQAWIDRAMWLGLGAAAAAIFITDLVVAVIRLARHRVAFFVPIIGCAAQFGLAIGAAAMESMAGPVS